MCSRIALLSLFVAFCVVSCAGANAADAEDQITSDVSPFRIYQQIGITFWDAENQLQARLDPFDNITSLYKSPLAKTDSLYQKYFWVDKSAGKYIDAIDQQKKQSWTLPPVLYLGGIAAFAIGDYANAQKYFSQLLRDYPDYKRYSYVGDSYTPHPDFYQPVKPSVTKLLFYCQLVGARGGAPTNARGAFVAFQHFNAAALKVLSSQTAFNHWLSNRPYKSQRRDFFLDKDYGDEPDQLRASALPKMDQLIQNGWQQLFAAALRKSGGPAMRKYLRTLASPDSSLHEIATQHLVEIDQFIIKSYFAEAKVLLAKNNFAATRAKYKQIIAEYPGSDASLKAEAELPKVVPIAVTYYAEEGKRYWKPGEGFLKPQTMSRQFY